MDDCGAPQWQPLSELEFLTGHISDGIDYALESLAMVGPEARYRLDAATVERMVSVWTVTVDDLKNLFGVQGVLWRNEAVGTAVAVRVDEYCLLVERNLVLATEMLAQAEALQDFTIERLMEKSDEQIGLEGLLGFFGHDE